MATEKKNTAPAAETPETQTTPETPVVQPEPPVENKNDRVEILIPRGAANDEPNLFVAVNGKSFLLPKGKKSTVPRYVYDEIMRSRKAEDIMEEHISGMTAQ